MALATSIPHLYAKSSTSPLNSVPWSIRITLGVPNKHIIWFYNILAIVYDVLSGMGYSNTNFIKLSITTIRCRLPFFVCINSRAKSMLIVWKGVWSFYVGIYVDKGVVNTLRA